MIHLIKFAVESRNNKIAKCQTSQMQCAFFFVPALILLLLCNVILQTEYFTTAIDELPIFIFNKSHFIPPTFRLFVYFFFRKKKKFYSIFLSALQNVYSFLPFLYYCRCLFFFYSISFFIKKNYRFRHKLNICVHKKMVIW